MDKHSQQRILGLALTCDWQTQCKKIDILELIDCTNEFKFIFNSSYGITSIQIVLSLYCNN